MTTKDFKSFSKAQLFYDPGFSAIDAIIAESEEELRSLLKKVKEESEKAGLKLNIQKAKIMASGPISKNKTGG